MTNHKLTCKELVELVTEYLENALSPSERMRFETHLQRCTGCTTYVEQMRQTIRFVGRLSEEAIPSETRDTLLALFRDWNKN